MPSYPSRRRPSGGSSSFDWAQDEDFFYDQTLTPHAEEARSAVSKHKAPATPFFSSLLEGLY
jgi:hypothetical protein